MIKGGLNLLALFCAFVAGTGWPTKDYGVMASCFLAAGCAQLLAQAIAPEQAEL